MADKAMVAVSFHNFDQATLLSLSLVKDPEGWKVDDVASPRLREIAKRLGVDREERCRRAVLGAHVRDGRSVRDRERGEAVAGELDEFVDDAMLAELLRERQHEVRRGGADRQRAIQAHANDQFYEPVIRGELARVMAQSGDPANAIRNYEHDNGLPVDGQIDNRLSAI